MKKIHFSLLVAVIVVGSISVSGLALSQPTDDYFVNNLEILANEALNGYNLEDYVQFYQYFAKDMAPIATKSYFQAVYIDSYKEDLGDILSKKLLRQESSLDPAYPVLVYSGIFEKFSNVLIKINFKREHDNYRITMIRFDRMHSELGVLH